MKFLNYRRLSTYPYVFIAVYCGFAVLMLVSALLSSNINVDFMGRPLGADFSHYWIAANMSKDGNPATVYDVSQFIKAQEDFFRVRYPLPFLYPPTWLLLLLPLAFFPYLLALGLWLGLTLGFSLYVIKKISPHPLTLPIALASPAVFQNFFHGQNGFLSAALLGGGLHMLQRNPWAGGVMLGLLSYKPNLWPLIPLALLAGRYWRALGATVLTALFLAWCSMMVLGGEAWHAYLYNLDLPMQLLQKGSLPLEKMVTLFSALILYGVNMEVAILIQAILMLFVGCVIYALWRREVSFEIQAGGLVLGALLFTPYAFSYDLTLLGLVIAWLVIEGQKNGWLCGEQWLYVMAWFAPFLVIFQIILPLPIAASIVHAFFIFLVVKQKKDYRSISVN